MKNLLKACALAGALLATPGLAETEKTWTLDGEFDTGVLDSVNHDAPNNHQLQLNTSSSTEPYIWIANFELGTVTKMDTRTGRQVAKYDSVLVKNWDNSVPTVRAPRGPCNSPSRTAVDGAGNAYVANRAICTGDSASLTKYGGSVGECVDRNGNGAIETSSDVNNDGLIDINSAAEFKGQADECVLWTKNYAAPADLGRSVAVDADQNVWVGGYSSTKLYKLNGATGALMQIIDPKAEGAPVSYIYGIAIGPGGFIYTSSLPDPANVARQIIFKINPNAPVGQRVVAYRQLPSPTYGIAVDKDGVVWLGNWSNAQFSLVRVDFTKAAPTTHGGTLGGCSGLTRGVAVDSNGDVWTSCWSGNRVLRFNSAGTFLGSWSVGTGPVGIAVDGDQKIWTVNYTAQTATRFDPITQTTQSFPTGGRPYSYSDMTGFQQRNFTQRQGDWTVVQDAGDPTAVWGRVSWNREPQGKVPAGTSITVEARVANTQADLASATYVEVSNGQPLSGFVGRFIEVRATLRIQTGNVSPVLSDLAVSWSIPPPPPPPSECIEVSLRDYNLFLLGDYNLGTDVEGKVAAGGNIVMNNFSVGHKLADSEIANTLVAGGNLTLTNGGVWGDARYGGSFSADTTVVQPRGTTEQGTPIDFTARGVALRTLSSRLNGLAVNGTTTREAWGGVMLHGTDPSVNVFQVDASAFNGAVLFYIEAPAGSTAIVNIAGASATFRGFGISFGGGINQNGVLFNFTDATSIYARGFGFWGTVLAPYAHVDFSDGSWDGGLYAKSLTGYAEGHINALNDRTICP